MKRHAEPFCASGLFQGASDCHQMATINE
jgi:hypothetical protein